MTQPEPGPKGQNDSPTDQPSFEQHPPVDPAAYAQQPQQTPQYQQVPQYQQPQPGQPMPQQPAPSYSQPSAAPQGFQTPGVPPQQSQPVYGSPLPQGVPPYVSNADSFGAGVPPMDKPYYGCTFGEAVSRFFHKYTVFTGRASRSEFWWFILFNFLVSIVLSIIGAIVGHGFTSWLSGIWDLAIVVPFIALGIRRLHDSNKSGWWILLPGIPMIVSSVLSMPLNARTQTLRASMMSGTGYEAAAGMVGLALIVALLSLITLISGIILMVAQSNPQGARYDIDFPGEQNGYAQPPMNGFTGTPAQNPGQPQA